MTSRGSAARNGHEQRPPAVDLSSVFGAAAAASSRRRVRTRRPRQARELEERTSDAEFAAGKSTPVEPEITEDDVHDTKRRRAPAAARSMRMAAPGPVSRRSDTPAPRRRFSVVKVRDRRHVDLLLLAAATKGPATGHEFIDLVRERSDGIFVLPLRMVIHRLHRLANNRLMQVTENRRVRRYSLTPFGERVLATRRREWEAFSHGFNRVLDAANDLGRDPGRGPARAE